MDTPTTLQAQKPRGLYSRQELTRLINPRSIAIIGASATPGSFGYRSVENTGFGYSGKVYPINPKHVEILGHKCYASIEDLPEAPDCVVLSVAREQVLPLVERCAKLGVGGAVIYSSGFAETGNDEGIAQERRLAAVARESGMRILGPNCIGIMNFVNRVGMTFQPGLNELPMITGPIGLVVQSGALGFIIAQGMQRGLGFSYNVAPGNSCDVDVCDLINFLIDDDTTKAIACVLEGIRDGRRLVDAARRALAAGKPLVVYKMGNNDLSRRTALSHTGTLAGSLAAYQAAFDRTGVVAVDDFEAVLETVAFFAVAGKPSAQGVGVMSASGGAAVMAADKAEQVGLLLPPLAPQTSAKLREKMPVFGSSANPCDITAASLQDMTMYGHCIRAFAEDPSFAAVVVPMMSAHAPSTVERAEFLCKLAGALSKPVCIVWLNEWYQGPGSEVYDHSRELSIFRSIKRCLKTLKAWIDYHEQREKLLSPPASRITGKDCATRAKAILSQCAPGQTLSERASKQLLAAYGIRVTREKLATTDDNVVKIAEEIGYPVALKAESEAITHKTEAGVVQLHLKNAEEVRNAFNAIHNAAARFPGKPKLNGVLVQEMIIGGVEVMVGTRQDSQFGPLIVCGLGGVLVEIFRDTACALAPVEKERALAMLKSLKGYPLLTGFRGSKPVNIDLLADTICRISELAADLGAKIAEMDVNPIIAGDARVIAVDALAVVGNHEEQ
ncbi:MAG: acetate--CoA ligase family protein [Betaproteobacteria bacterium]|nr:acetate--CoA ligase family protein [Betaproteobacteria bacterium]